MNRETVRQAGLHPGRTIVLRRAERLAQGPPSVRAAASVIVTATAVVVVAAALAMRIFDAAEFPNIWRSLWWSLQTASTVGYGDVTPVRPVGRVIGAIAMLQGIAFLAVVTASITSVFVTRAQRELSDETEHWQSLATQIDALSERVESIAAAIDRLAPRSPSSDDAEAPDPALNSDQQAPEEE